MSARIFRLTQWTGVLGYLCSWASPKRQAKWIAKRLLRSQWQDASIGGAEDLVVEIQSQAFRVVDREGRVEPWEPCKVPVC